MVANSILSPARMYESRHTHEWVMSHRATQLSMYVHCLIYRFQVIISLIVQYKYKKSCAEDQMLLDLILRMRLCSTAYTVFDTHPVWPFHFHLTKMVGRKYFIPVRYQCPKGTLAGLVFEYFYMIHRVGRCRNKACHKYERVWHDFLYAWQNTYKFFISHSQTWSLSCCTARSKRHETIRRACLAEIRASERKTRRVRTRACKRERKRTRERGRQKESGRERKKERKR